MTPIKKNKDKTVTSSQQISPVRDSHERLQKMDASCSTSVEETFVIKVHDKHQSQQVNRDAESIRKVEEIPEEETVEEEIIPDIPIVITDDAILDVNDECARVNSRP